MHAVDHVVLGAGAVGMAVAEALAARGKSVRVVNRSGPITGGPRSSRVCKPRPEGHARVADVRAPLTLRSESN